MPLEADGSPARAAAADTDVFSQASWLMVKFAFAATVINYLDRQTLSVAAPALREDFGMSNEDCN